MDDGDDKETPEVPTGEQIEAASIIDPEALKHWFALDAQSDIIMNVSRVDMDQLLLGLRNLVFAQGDTLQALQLTTLNKMDDANFHFSRAVQRNFHALQQITRFTGLLMARAETDD